jgi:hypothetical protein
MLRVLAAVILSGVADDLAEATRLLKAAQEEAAVQVLTRSLDRSGLASSERASLYVLLGIARVNLRDEEGGSLAFQRALEADPTVTLPPKIAAPRARELFDSAKVEVSHRKALPKVPEPKPEPAAPALTAAPPQVQQAKPADHAGRWIGVALAVAGMASGGTGAYFMVSGTSLRGQAVSEPVATTSAQLFSRAQTDWAIGLSLVSVGAALLVTGIITALML